MTPDQVLSLAECVRTAADRPTGRNRQAFIDVLLSGEVGFPVSERQPAGSRTVTSKDKFSVPTTRLPNGTLMLLVYSDVAQMARMQQGRSFIELDARTVLEIAARASSGVVVQNGADDNLPWLAVPKEEVVKILAKG
jgi:hypothetical protein